MQKKKGISLIVLVITIIVMIILAGAIILTLNNNGIIGQASKAVDLTNEKQVQVLADTLWSDAYLYYNGKGTQAQLQQAVEKGLEKNGVNLDNYIITITPNGVELQQFDRTNWEHGYAYTRETDTWSGRIEKANEKDLKGDIIVKLYKTEELVDPDETQLNAFIQDFNLPATELVESNAYKMTIEGTGDMGALMPEDASQLMTATKAWQLEYLGYLTGQSTVCVTPYITDVIIEDGVTNIGIQALLGAISLKSVVMGDDVEKIDFGAFILCESLNQIHVSSKEEWNNVVVEKYNYKLLDANITYDYRTKVERLANEGWQKAKDEGKTTDSSIQSTVNTYLTENGISANKTALYNITATTKGVTVTGKETTLGATILDGADYGKTVNYTANGINSWKVLYKQTVDNEEYVYLIASENAPASSLPAKLTDTVANGGAGAKFNGKNIYWSSAPSVVASGSINTKRWLANWSDYATNKNGRCITYFLDENYWTAFKNTSKYGTNVVGTIGTPTAEMIVKSYNKRSEAIGDTENGTLTLSAENYGYKINGGYWVDFSRLDKLYTPSYKSEEYTWLASSSDSSTDALFSLYYSGAMNNDRYNYTYLGVRPVVCLKSSIPAYVGVTADSADIILK